MATNRLWIQHGISLLAALIFCKNWQSGSWAFLLVIHRPHKTHHNIHVLCACKPFILFDSAAGIILWVIWKLHVIQLHYLQNILLTKGHSQKKIMTGTNSKVFSSVLLPNLKKKQQQKQTQCPRQVLWFASYYGSVAYLFSLTPASNPIHKHFNSIPPNLVYFCFLHFQVNCKNIVYWYSAAVFWYQNVLLKSDIPQGIVVNFEQPIMSKFSLNKL